MVRNAEDEMSEGCLGCVHFRTDHMPSSTWYICDKFHKVVGRLTVGSDAINDERPIPIKDDCYERNIPTRKDSIREASNK